MSEPSDDVVIRWALEYWADVRWDYTWHRSYYLAQWHRSNDGWQIA